MTSQWTRGITVFPARPSEDESTIRSAGSAKRESSRRPGITRERLGCLTCRHRKKKCDNTYPVCGHCTRLNLVCTREKPRALLLDRNSCDGYTSSGSPISPSFSTQKSFGVATISRAPDTSILGEFMTSEGARDRRRMLTYYTQVLAGLLTTTHDNNSFLSVFLPMAMESPPLQKSLVAWSSAHLSCHSKTHHVNFLAHQSSALIQASLALSQHPQTLPEGEVTLATCLVLCAVDIASGDTENWYHHLVGAKEVITSMQTTGHAGILLHGSDCFKASKDGQWLLRNFAYHDIIGAVLSDRSPLIPGQYWLDQNGSTLVDSYMGYSAEIMAILADISMLDNPDRVVQDDSHKDDIRPNFLQREEDIDFWRTAEELESKLRDWSCPTSPDSCLVHLAATHRSTALIVLYRKQQMHIYNHNRSTQSDQQSQKSSANTLNSKLAAEITKSLHHISQIPVGSLPESSTLFPLFIAGSSTALADEIEFVRQRMKAFLDFRYFGNITRANEVLEELWRLRSAGVKSAGGREVDWGDILRRSKWKLMLS